MRLPGEGSAYSRLNSMFWKTNLSQKDIEFVKTNINFPSPNGEDFAYSVHRAAYKVILLHDLTTLYEEIKMLNRDFNFLKRFLLDYLNSDQKIKFITKILKNKIPDDELWQKSIVRCPPVESIRTMIHIIIFLKQIGYNKINQKYSDHLVEKIQWNMKINLDGMFEVYQHWIDHKLKQQMLYNKKHQKYSEHIVEDILKQAEFRKKVISVPYHETYKNFLLHKKQVKKKGW